MNTEMQEPEQADEALLNRLRSICLALPESDEHHGGVGSPSFRVREKIFAMRHNADGRPSLWCKAPAGVQGILVGSYPARFFVPPYVGRYGWVGIWLDDGTDWDELADLITESYKLTAPRRLKNALEQ